MKCPFCEYETLFSRWEVNMACHIHDEHIQTNGWGGVGACPCGKTYGSYASLAAHLIDASWKDGQMVWDEDALILHMTKGALGDARS